MGRNLKISSVGAVLGLLAGCAVAPDPFNAQVLPKGEPLNIRNILAAHPNKKACIDYQAATNSSSSIITSTVEGNTMISKELAALRIPNSTAVQNVELSSRSMLQGDRACVRGEDVSVTGRDPMSAALLSATHGIITEFGGTICGTYFRSGDGYIVTTIGANGKPVPPGDTKFQFILGDLKLRAQ